jgi:uncharacterized protein (DUF2147 family)
VRSLLDKSFLVLFFKKELLLLFLLALPVATAAAASPTGDWFTEHRDGVITIAPCGNAMCGEISGVSTFAAGGGPPRSWNGASQCHLGIIHDMRLGADGIYNGTITDPRNGDVYQAELWAAADGTLRLRGYIAIPLLGSTQTWTRFTGKLGADCHFSR